MKASILIAAHNDREALLNTVRACRGRSAGVDLEIVVGDDASTDGSAAALEEEFPSVRVARNCQRMGVSPARQLAAREAQGEAFVFLDAHCNPEPGAIARLVEDVRETGGNALITPKIPALDVARWENTPQQIGHGYRLELERFDCGWIPLEQMVRVREGAREFYESPAMIGCALAVSRKLYEKLWGFDADMRMWGVEDLDFSLKCWLAGHRILHDPQAVVGHRFRTTFDNFDAPIEHFLVNQLRMAWKNFTEGVWIEWVDRTRRRHCQQLSEHPEGLWARVWLMFNETRASADAERVHLSAQQVHDELWYADRFGLNWPRLAPLPGESASGGFQSPAAKRRDDDGPSPSPAPPCDCSTFQDAVDSAQSALDDANSALDEANDGLDEPQQAVDEAQDALDSANDQVSTASDAYDDAESQFSDAEDATDEALSEVTDQSASLDDSNSSVQESQGAVDSAYSAVPSGSSCTALVTLNGEVQQAYKALQKAKESGCGVVQAQQRYDQLLSQYNTDVAALQAELSSVWSPAVTALSTACDEATPVFQEAQSTADSLGQAISGLLDALSQEQTASDQLDTAGGNLDDAFSDVDSATASLSDAEDTLGEAQVAVASAQADVDDAQDNLDDAQRQLENCQSGKCDGGDVPGRHRDCSGPVDEFNAAQQAYERAQKDARDAKTKLDQARQAEDQTLPPYEAAWKEYNMRAGYANVFVKTFGEFVADSVVALGSLASAAARLGLAAANDTLSSSPGSLATLASARAQLTSAANEFETDVGLCASMYNTATSNLQWLAEAQPALDNATAKAKAAYQAVQAAEKALNDANAACEAAHKAYIQAEVNKAKAGC
jgi:GT2 family glycosyltransferase